VSLCVFSAPLIVLDARKESRNWFSWLSRFVIIAVSEPARAPVAQRSLNDKLSLQIQASAAASRCARPVWPAMILPPFHATWRFGHDIEICVLRAVNHQHMVERWRQCSDSTRAKRDIDRNDAEAASYCVAWRMDSWPTNG
jgi:hypothetical protein